jgi:cytochrome c-type biogenesis protein CcmF
MMAEIGFISSILALCFTTLQGVVPLWASYKKQYYWMAVSIPLAYLVFVTVLISFVCLMTSFITNDFSVAYVATTSNSMLPIHYRITAMWGAHEGALLLWVFILAVWGALVARFSREIPMQLRAKVLAVIGLVGIGFISFMIFTSNPFERSLPYIPIDGEDLNPLLQDFGFLIHPPFLYLGYVGFVVAFAFSIAALLEGRFDTAIAKWTRSWTIAAWALLTIGISLGSWWAYYELGWGGWWMWDPVENASFMPWLTGTALVHALIISEKRGTYKGWTLFLAIATFSLTLLGTFLVRSGVLTSVHAFAANAERGVFILVFLGLVIGSALTLFMVRGFSVQSHIHSKLLSREGLMLMNNLLLACAGLMVLLGTIAPLIYDALSMGKISIGAPYFDKMFLLIFVPLLTLMTVGPLLRWKRDSLTRVLQEYKKEFIAVILVTIIGGSYLAVAVSLWAVFVLFVLASVLASVWIDIKKRVVGKKSGISGLRKIHSETWSMHIAHIGLLCTVIGIVMTGSLSLQKDIRLGKGDYAIVGDYKFTLLGQRNYQGPNFIATAADIKVTRGSFETVLQPEKRRYTVRGQTMTEAGIDAGLFRDIYVSLGEPMKNGDWALRVYIKPFMRWVWLGTIIMALSAVIILIGRFNKRSRQV